jgi:hypothetical protein
VIEATLHASGKGPTASKRVIVSAKHNANLHAACFMYRLTGTGLAAADLSGCYFMYFDAAMSMLFFSWYP